MADVPTNGEVNFNIVFKGLDGDMPTNDNESEGNPAAPSNVGKPSASNSTSSNSKNVALAAGVNVALNMSKQAVNAAISNISIATGDSLTQERIQNGINTIGTSAALIAACCTNIYTAIAAVASLLISSGAKAWQEQNRLKWSNIDATNKAKIYGFASNEGR
ncbi:MAG: hypothetical protein ACI4MN_06010 [Candidatus Coproplasma sp.]